MPDALDLLTQLKYACLWYFEHDEVPESYWNGTIKKIVAEMIEGAQATGTKEALLQTELFIQDSMGRVAYKEAITVSERALLTRLTAQFGGRALGMLASGIFILGTIMMNTTAAAASTGEIHWEYRNYVKKYLKFMARSVRVHQHQKQRVHVPVPQRFQEYLDEPEKRYNLPYLCH